jgi:peroxiredoxin
LSGRARPGDGAPNPGGRLPGVDGKIHKLSDYKSSPLLMVMFICNHCPTSQPYEGRMKKPVADCKGKGVVFVAIQPNDPRAVRLSEMGYTDVGDSLEEMKVRAEHREFNFPYLNDGDTQTVTQAFGAQATPHVFLFDKERKLRYEGRINDCRAQELKAIAAQPVTVEMATAEDLKKLRSNPTNKVLLVNFWATWCGPCISEFGALQDTYRMFRCRNFNMVTVSANLPDEKNGVIKILQEQHATTRNLQFATSDTYGLQAAFDARWDSAVNRARSMSWRSGGQSWRTWRTTPTSAIPPTGPRASGRPSDAAARWEAPRSSS